MSKKAAEQQTHKMGQVNRIGRYLYRMTPVHDENGEVMNHIATPFRVELHPRDVMQIIAGSSLIALPMVFTGEVWDLGNELPLVNLLALSLISIVMVILFIYFNVYRDHLHEHMAGFVMRVIATLLISLFVATMLLTLLNRAPWQSDALLAIKRVLLVSCPASMGAAFGDNLS